jgi:transmembrane sensor
MRWLRASPIHVAEYLIVTGIAGDVAELARGSTVSTGDLLIHAGDSVRWLELSTEGDVSKADDSSPRAYHSGRRFAPSRQSSSRQSLGHWVAALATLVIVLGVTLAGWHGFAPRQYVETFGTGHGQERSVRLPDDTFVQLDSDSSITIRFDHGMRRVVLNRGQAYFRVTKDVARPFSVRVGRSVIRDIGTAFDVYLHTSSTTVTVAEGRIQISSLPHPVTAAESWLSWFEHQNRQQGTVLTDLAAGQQVRMDNDGQVMSLGSVDVERTLAWTQGRIAFDNESIASVAAEFNRYNDMQISVSDPRIGTMLISGAFDSHDAPAFVASLGSLPGVEIKKHGLHIEISTARRERQHRD